MSVQQSESSKKRKNDDVTTNPTKKSKTVEEYVHHLRSNRDIFEKRHKEIMKMQERIEELSEQLEREQKKYAIDVEELKKESAERLPDGIVQDPNLFDFHFHIDDDPIAWKINRHICKIEGDPKNAFLDFLNGEWRGSEFNLSSFVKGIGKTYAERLKEALPIEDFYQIEKILGKKRAARIALGFCYRFNR